MKSTHNKIILILGIIIVAAATIILTVFLTPIKKVHYATLQISPMDLVQTVTATGQVVGDENVSLAFDTAGTIAAVNVQVGDSVKKDQILGSLSSDILSANLESAQANVAAAQADLTQLAEGNRPEAIAVYQQKLSDAQSALNNSLHDAYLKTQDAVENNSDILFNNPESTNPQIDIITQNQDQIGKDAISNERLILGEKLAAWGNISIDDTTGQAQQAASDTLAYAKQFFTDLTTITNALQIGDTGYTQSQIDTYQGAVNAGAGELNAATSEYVSALSTFNDASQALTLEEATGTPIDIQAQSAKVAAAQAQADIIQSQINHTIIRAPFDGIITEVDLKAGEVAVPGNPAFGIITSGLKVEVQIPESDISKIAVGEPASITLDAYGADTPFAAAVTEIDPAETVVNGINSYKVTLQFDATDSRIRSGMTANVAITTAELQQTLAVPSQAIITQGTSYFVLAEDSKGNFSQQQVQTGITGSDGYTAITSGVTAGETIASFGNDDQQTN